MIFVFLLQNNNACLTRLAVGWVEKYIQLLLSVKLNVSHSAASCQLSAVTAADD